MKNVTIKQLRYFEALMKYAHFGHAAEASKISQPALSQQIKELETGLGQILFERSARSVNPTAFAHLLAPKVRDILSRTEELALLARAQKSQWIGRFALGVIPTIAPYLLPKIVKNLALSCPDIDLHIRETLTSTLLDSLGRGEIDAAILALPLMEEAFFEYPLIEEEFVLLRPYSDAHMPIPNAAELAQMRLLLLEEGHCFREQALSFCDMPTAYPRDGFDASSLATLVQMVSAGIGVTLIPEMAIPIETAAAHVSITRFQNPAPKRSIGMIWRKSNPLFDHLHRIAEVLGPDLIAASLARHDRANEE